MVKKKTKRLVSACLLGISCKYDGTHNQNAKVRQMLKHDVLIPVCPEQLGGLSVPRSPSEQKGNKVVSATGRDVTRNFIKGARETLKIARLYEIKEAIFKQRSPSCGVGQIYDGTFSGKVVQGDGITTALLKAHGVTVIPEERTKSYLAQ